MNNSLIYVASPYTHKRKEVMEERYKRTVKEVSNLILQKHHVISPIIHCHPIAQEGHDVCWEYWKHYNTNILMRCDKMLVLQLEGWEESLGVAEEVTLAKELGITIEYSGTLY